MYDYGNFPPDFFLCSKVRTNVSHTFHCHAVGGRHSGRPLQPIPMLEFIFTKSKKAGQWKQDEREREKGMQKAENGHFGGKAESGNGHLCKNEAFIQQGWQCHCR